MLSNREIRQRISKVYSSLKTDYDDYKPFWQALSEYSASFRGKFIGEDDKAFLTRSDKIIDNTLNQSLVVLSAGLQSGLTNQTSRWFKFSLEDKELLKYKPVKTWLYDCENIIYAILSKSNFYKVMPEAYKELGLFGQPCIHHAEDVNTISHFTNFTCGEYMLASDEKGRINTCIREFAMTVGQLISAFGIDNAPSSVKNAYDSGKMNGKYNVVHAVVPNFMMEKGKIDDRNKSFLSVYYCKQSDDDELLRVSGYDQFPIHAPRWEVVSNETYGIAPAMYGLGCSKALQKLHIAKHRGIDYQSNPVWNLPRGMYKDGKKPALLPGAIVLYDEKQGHNAVTSAVDIHFDIAAVRECIAENRADIRESMFSDVFKMIANTKKAATATEIMELQEEKMILLGPVLHNIINDGLVPGINRTFDNANKLGALPPPPPELDGKSLDIEFLSSLAQAQKMMELNSSVDFAQFVGNMAQYDPNAMKKLNTNALIDDYADKRGVNPHIVNSNQEVEQMIAAENQANAQVQQMEMAKQALEGAKALSDIDTAKMMGAV